MAFTPIPFDPIFLVLIFPYSIFSPPPSIYFSSRGFSCSSSLFFHFPRRNLFFMFTISFELFYFKIVLRIATLHNHLRQTNSTWHKCTSLVSIRHIRLGEWNTFQQNVTEVAPSAESSSEKSRTKKSKAEWKWRRIRYPLKMNTVLTESNFFLECME